MSAQADSDDWFFGDEKDSRLTLATRLVWVLGALFVVALVWAWFAELDEVATGAGRVVPTSREQMIESLEGGILAKLQVRQDDIVAATHALVR